MDFQQPHKLIYLALDAGFKVVCIRPVPNLANLLRNATFALGGGLSCNNSIAQLMRNCAGDVYKTSDFIGNSE
jgi:hypothetical protein